MDYLAGMLYSFFNTLVKNYLKYRNQRILRMYSHPAEQQAEVFRNLVQKLSNTEYGKQNDINSTTNYTQFSHTLPITQYEDLFVYINRMMQGEESILWPGKIEWFAKSSGTTNDKSKFIPITEECIAQNHVAASWDAMSILYQHRPEARIFDGKSLIMGGSLQHISPTLTTGDVSAILLHRMPLVGKPFYTPDIETALLSDWEEKIEKIARQCIHEDVVMFAGVPTWTIVLFKRILEITGKSNMREVWPNVRTYLHGGVGFEPYVQQFNEFLPFDDMEYYEVYNASEGYFAFQDRLHEKGMLLLVDNAIFYEFIPADQIDNPSPTVLTLSDVQEGTDYCIVISTTGGLWRYKPGDLVRFVSLKPYRIIVSGRTKHFINVFGEEVMVHNTDQALKQTCDKLGGIVSDYTVAPVFMGQENKGGHEWLIEFSQPPRDIALFAAELDNALRSINSDYDAKRHKNIALQPLQLHTVPSGTFHNWLRSKGRIGGQSKIPRLSNSRAFLEEIKSLLPPS